MRDGVRNRHRWGVILAGGDGVRLRPLTSRIAGDNRPKQFCALRGGESLLARTRRRIARVVSPDRTVLAFTATHRRYYEGELLSEPARWVIQQPLNKGTAPAILSSLLLMREIDRNAIAAFFPCDHHFTNDASFREGVDLAFRTAEAHRDSVVLLGEPPTHAETDYGWIAPGEPVAHPARARKVIRFWEKPSAHAAACLLSQGCLWNTFVLVGRVDAFLSLIEEGDPKLFGMFAAAVQDRGRAGLASLYARLETVDFAKRVLAPSASRLLVVPFLNAGWTDLGTPERAAPLAGRKAAHDPAAERAVA